MLIFNSKLRAGAALACLALALGGCAIQRIHDNGMDLIQEGRIEEGLQKLDQASKADTDNVAYRNDYLRTRNQATNMLLADASTAQSQGQMGAAQNIYLKVLRIDPENRNAQRALETIARDERHRVILEQARALIAKGDLEEARGALNPVLIENPTNGPAGMLVREIDEQEAKTQTSEPILSGKFRKPISLQFRDANVKMVFEALSRTSGINVLLDKDVSGDIKTSIFVRDVSVKDAIDLILMQTQLEKKILSDNTLYIYPNTATKIKDFKDLKVRSFHLTYADPKNMMGLIKTLFKTKDIVVHEKTSSLIMRDTPEAIHLAEKLIQDQDVADPEVMLEVEVLEVTRARMHDLGLQYPAQMAFGAMIPPTTTTTTNVTTGISSTTTQPGTTLTLGNLRQINRNLISVSPAPAMTLNLMLQDSDTNVLSSPRLRVKNREKAKIMIGERVPIITNSVTPVNGSTPVVTGTVSYQDVGLKFDVEPEIHQDNEVTIKLGLEVSSLGAAVTNSASGSLVYTVGTRNILTSLRLHDGETQILAGLITDSDTSTTDKVPLLGQIPLLGHLFSNDNGKKSKTEIILSITPHLVGSKKIPDAREMEYWSGTESALRSDQVVLKPLGVVSLTGTSPGAATASARQSAGIAQIPSAGAATTANIAPAEALAPGMPLPAGSMSRPPVAKLTLASPPAPEARSAPEDAVVNSSIVFDWAGPEQAKVGDRISVQLNAQSLHGVKALALDVGFDPSVLKALDVSGGNAMKQNNAPLNLTKTIDQVGGGVVVNLTGSGASNSAGLLTLTFEVLAPAKGTTVVLNSVTATMEDGEAQTPALPAPFSISAEQ
ncbi:MAG: type II and III secretion system protein [Nitrosomonadales bacterium]|nr:type II and III secretion system protein [Nitrosomonadales bacterium]